MEVVGMSDNLIPFPTPKPPRPDPFGGDRGTGTGQATHGNRDPARWAPEAVRRAEPRRVDGVRRGGAMEGRGGEGGAYPGVDGEAAQGHRRSRGHVSGRVARTGSRDARWHGQTQPLPGR